MAIKIFIIAGEASGDLHGSNLTKALFEKDPSLNIKAYGGPKMQKSGAQIVREYQDFAFMGFLEVASNIRTVLGNIKKTESLILSFNPDIIIFIDFPGFNLRIAKSLKPLLANTRFIYYIAPQVWAWKSNRVHILNKLMDEIFVILPFEKDFFEKYDYKVKYVGHPLLEEINHLPKIEKTKNLIAILPGSRKQEIRKMLPTLIRLAANLPEFQFEISMMPDIPKDFYEGIVELESSNIAFSNTSTYNLLSRAHLALVTSGTATLETALLNTPQIVAYKTSHISYWIAKRIVKIKYISLVNLILDRAVVRELIQDELTVENLIMEIRNLNTPSQYETTLASYLELKTLLGDASTSKQIAEAIL